MVNMILGVFGQLLPPLGLSLSRSGRDGGGGRLAFNIFVLKWDDTQAVMPGLGMRTRYELNYL